MRSLNSNLYAIIIAITLLVGCTNDTDGRFAISGSVSYDGEPIKAGSIGFVSTDNNVLKSAGADIVDGRYSIPLAEGPTSGSYIVSVEAERPTGRKILADEGSTDTIDEMERYIPEIYNTFSKLNTEITGNQDDLNFDLEKPKRSRR